MSNAPAAPKRAMDPNNLNDIDGLAVWALKFTKERAQALDQGSSTARPSRVQEPGLSATANHIPPSAKPVWAMYNLYCFYGSV
ncbi:hypothetical protein FS749_001738 [Ceratobasidium sp. UAMH 11750]|nr:hypothetical protein FS749_001738 [Ceratobasidium sp. UAMH 11750]